MSAPLSIRGLTRHFPGSATPTVEGLDLEVPAGGCVALLGPSGSGKSTVLRLVAGLDTPDGGDVAVDGRSLAGVPTEGRRTVLVFQKPRLFPHLDVLDNVAFPLAVTGLRRREARRDATRFLELVGLGDFSRRRPGTLSGGQEQRVALARALAARADVILLDEPFSALDPAVRAEMHTLLTELRAAVEPTILLVTHDRHEAAVLADTVAVLLDGRIAQHDTVSVLHAQPSSLAVNAFLGGRNVIPGHVSRGFHRSALGVLELPRVTAGESPAALVIRQESVRLTARGDSAADLTGTVVSAVDQGPRALVEVEIQGGPSETSISLIVAEVGGWAAPHVGDAVGVVLPLEQRHVLALGQDDAGPGAAVAAPGISLGAG